MKLRLFLPILSLTLAPLSAQTLIPTKVLGFAQVAVGESIETVINITNRGTTTYYGTLFLYRNGWQNWTLNVNDQPVETEFSIMLSPGETETLRITKSTVLETGFAGLVPSDQTGEGDGDFSPTNQIEGNLTYFIKSGSQIVDAVGVLPSAEFFVTVIPFDNFPTIAVALVNFSSEEKTASVSLRLYSEDGTLVATSPLSLVDGGHIANFLSDFFPGVSLERGRVEIESDIPIAGTSLALVEGEFAALPLTPSTAIYSFYMSKAIGEVRQLAGELSVWVDGFAIEGFLWITEVNEVAVEPYSLWMAGTLGEGKVEIGFTGRGLAFENEKTIVHVGISGFTFQASTVTGNYHVSGISQDFTDKGVFVINKIL